MDTPTLDHRPSTLGEQELNEFRRTVRRELAQRSDGTHPAAALQAVAVAVRGLLAQRWAATQAADAQRRQRRVHYLSMEFLMGRALDNALQALGLRDEVLAAVGPGAPTLQAILDQEPDAALGNGGLGRLAACFLDAFAALDLPSFGYGLRYEHGMFAQAIEGGRQVELPDPWLEHGHPWELVRPELVYVVGFGGTVTHDAGSPRWLPAETVLAQACDFIVPGHGTPRVSTLRQWRARASRPIDFAAFCAGAHQASGAHKQEADALNWVLYPDDSTDAGRRLRLRQEFFLVSASLQDMLARHLREQPDVASFGRHNAVHLNDTHPALAPAELMRLLLDQHGLGWDAAWAVTRQATSYTNHTLMPEALETWPVPLLAELLPRHLDILYEINRRFLDEVRARCPGDEALVQRVSLIDEGGAERRRTPRPHGHAGHPGLAARERRLGAALAADGADHLCRLRAAVARTFLQRDQRRHAAALAGPGPPWPGHAAGPAPGRRLAARPDAAPRPGEAGRQPAPRRRVRAGQAGQQAGPGPAHRTRHRPPRRPDQPVRRADQAHPRVQAPAAEPAARGGALPGHRRATGRETGRRAP